MNAVVCGSNHLSGNTSAKLSTTNASATIVLHFSQRFSCPLRFFFLLRAMTANSSMIARLCFPAGKENDEEQVADQSGPVSSCGNCSS